MKQNLTEEICLKVMDIGSFLRILVLELGRKPEEIGKVIK